MRSWSCVPHCCACTLSYFPPFCPHLSAYNILNGGMLTNATDFFTDDGAMDAFAQRLGYLVARFAHHTSLFAFELFNEANCMHPAPTVAAYKSWHQRMARVIKRADIYGHLVTTSFCGNDYTHTQSHNAVSEAVYRLSEMDFAQTHAYQGPHGNKLQDAAFEVAKVCGGVATTGVYSSKPHFW